MIKARSLTLLIPLLMSACSTSDNGQPHGSAQEPFQIEKYIKERDLRTQRHEAIAAYSKTVTDKISRQPFTKEERELSDVGKAGTFSIGILANGNLENIEVTKSTGSRSADEEIIKRIKSASPFSSPPASAIGTSGIFHVITPLFYSKPQKRTGL